MKRIYIALAILVIVIASLFVWHKVSATDNGWPTDPATLVDKALLTAPQGNKTAVWCWYKYSNGQEHSVYGGLVDTAQLNSGYIHFGCQK